MELTGVLNRGCSRVNQLGSRLSQPATSGRRVLPLNTIVTTPMCRSSSNRINAGATSCTAPVPANPTLSACGIGLTRSMRSLGTNAITLSVPSMNISAMIGAATSTDRVMLRLALRVSPAMIATYSNPLSAPSPILPRMLRLYGVNVGADTLSGWYATGRPCASATSGTINSAAKVRTWPAPPTSCTQRPMRRPSTEIIVTPSSTSVLTSGVYHQMLESVALLPLKTYAALVAIVTPKPAAITIAYAHRFQATMNPANLPSAIVVHWYSPPSSGISRERKITTAACGR